MPGLGLLTHINEPSVYSFFFYEIVMSAALCDTNIMTALERVMDPLR